MHSDLLIILQHGVNSNFCRPELTLHFLFDPLTFLFKRIDPFVFYELANTVGLYLLPISVQTESGMEIDGRWLTLLDELMLDTYINYPVLLNQFFNMGHGGISWAMGESFVHRIHDDYYTMCQTIFRCVARMDWMDVSV